MYDGLNVRNLEAYFIPIHLTKEANKKLINLSILIAGDLHQSEINI